MRVRSTAATGRATTFRPAASGPRGRVARGAPPDTLLHLDAGRLVLAVALLVRHGDLRALRLPVEGVAVGIRDRRAVFVFDATVAGAVRFDLALDLAAQRESGTGDHT